MARFIPDPNSKFNDHFIDTEAENPGTLYQRIAGVYPSNPRFREYAIEFGGVQIAFYPVDEIYEANLQDDPSLRKVLLSNTTIVDGVEVPSLHSRVVAVEERPSSGIFVSCGHKGW
jgi:hypothetical protein